MNKVSGIIQISQKLVVIFLTYNEFLLNKIISQIIG